jgi:DNA polymerase-1
MKINRPYVQEALQYTETQALKARREFGELTGIEYQDSAGVFKKAFQKFDIELPLTRTGKPCTNKQVLDALENPVADKIREIRSYEKLAGTYYSSFLFFADEHDFIRANMRQGGTETSRFSYSDPNLQNCPKEDEEEDRDKPYIVRRSFIPPPDFCLVPIDYKQQEFRMMLDYAGERELIAAIMNGVDVHEATAQLMGVTRKFAKTLNFGLLYGMGAAKLAKALKIPLEEAYELRALYFAKLPRVQALIRGVMNTGSQRGYIWNWFGFRNHLSSPEYAYVLPNHLIQGGCAQVIRVAMVRLDAYLRTNRLRSAMLAQVHDELLFQVHKDELHHVPELQKIMEAVYQPKNGLVLECSVEHSWKSWGKFDQVKGYPVAA